VGVGIAPDGTVSREPDTAAAASRGRPGERVALYAWTAVALAVAVVAVVLGWHARGGTTDPTALLT